MTSTFAVVTGGTKGIGHAICLSLAKEGFNIATCSRSHDDLEKLRQELDQYDVEILTKVTDVSKKNEVLAFSSFVKNRWETIDILVNNAGIFIPGEILREEEGNLEMMLQTNLCSAYHLTRDLMPNILESSQGHIFNMCSIASIIAYPNGGSYSISKFALLGFSRVLREELKEKNVKVTAILPGATWSDSWKGADFPADRLMQTQDIADTVLASYKLSNSAVVEEIVIRPQLGDL